MAKIVRTSTQLLADLENMYNNISQREWRYNVNYNRYVNNGNRSGSIWNLKSTPLTYYFGGNSPAAGILPIYNYLRSAIETIISKMSQTKVRPFFNPVNGTWQTYKICENAQVFFDEYYQEESIYEKATEALRKAMIFEFGALWVDEGTTTIREVAPWQVIYDPREFNYRNLSRIVIEFREFPVQGLLDEGVVKSVDELPGNLASAFRQDRGTFCTVRDIYYDLVSQERIEFVDNIEVKRVKLQSDECPIEFIWFNNPIKGGTSTSSIDDVWGIQYEIDATAQRLHDAKENSPFNSIFIPNGALGKSEGIKRSSFSNKAGMIWEYDASMPGASMPVVSTPRFIDPQWIENIEFNGEKIYQLLGISQLSAQSKKPSGINSGVALDTLQDVESERFNVLLQNMIQLFMKVAYKIINIFPDNAEIIPKRLGVKKISWKEVRGARDEYSLQFSPASVLSNDPKTKMEEVEKLVSMKLLQLPQAMKLLEFPDTNGAFNVNTASFDDCQAIIQRAIDEEDYSFYEVVNIQELYQECVTTLLRLDSNNEDPTTLTRLTTLMERVKRQMDSVNQVAAPPPGSPPPPPSLQGPQITSIIEVLKEVNQGTLSAETASALLTMSFPATPGDAIQAMVKANQTPPTPGSQPLVQPVNNAPQNPASAGQ